jgi:hypothetical protein
MPRAKSSANHIVHRRQEFVTFQNFSSNGPLEGLPKRLWLHVSQSVV